MNDFFGRIYYTDEEFDEDCAKLALAVQQKWHPSQPYDLEYFQNWLVARLMRTSQYSMELGKIFYRYVFERASYLRVVSHPFVKVIDIFRNLPIDLNLSIAVSDILIDCMEQHVSEADTRQYFYLMCHRVECCFRSGRYDLGYHRAKQALAFLDRVEDPKDRKALADLIDDKLFEAHRKAGSVELALENATKLMTSESDPEAPSKYIVYIISVTDHDTEAFQIWEDLVMRFMCLLSEDHASSRWELLHLARQIRICFASPSFRNAGRYGYKEVYVAVNEVVTRENESFYYESYDEEIEDDLESEKNLA